VPARAMITSIALNHQGGPVCLTLSTPARAPKLRKLRGFRQKLLGRHISMAIMMRRKGSSEQVTPLERHAVGS
jgi:hypothetical protein